MINTKTSIQNRSVELTKLSKLYQKIYTFQLALGNQNISQAHYNLSISSNYKFIWFRVAKSGTRTLFNLFDKHNIKLSADHAMAVRYNTRAYLNYFKFAFVRNPWDRVFSCWKNKVLQENYFGFNPSDHVKMQDFSNFIGFIENTDLEKANHHIKLQSALIDLNNVDFVGKLENFDQDIKTVFSNIGIPFKSSLHLNKTDIGYAYQKAYTTKLKEQIAKKYAADIDAFGYTF
ncbi:MAG: sulfotransferase family 2 domain-containing protein [Bacteroidia bacterium]